MLTASHNPPQYNGIKLWNPDGSAFDTNQRKHIEQLMVEERQETTPWQLMERYVQFPEAVEKHTSRILDNFTGSFPLKVALDCGCGAGSMATPYIVRELGCEVIALNSFPSGFFPRGIEPLPGNLVNLIETIRATGADLGLAHDADADRLTVVDDKGRVVPGDKLLILLARDLGARKIVTTVDASMTIEEQGLDVIRTRVGDAYVAEELRNGGDFGGEPSGSWIFPSMSYCPDGIHAAAQVIRIASKEKLSSQIDRIPSYFIRRGSIPGDGVTIGAIRRNLGQLAPLYMSHDDGLRFSFSDGWLLVRLSGTEPLIRITAEAKTAEMVDNLYQSTLQAIEKLAGKKKANKRK
jgi:phosphoglucosamine mutase